MRIILPDDYTVVEETERPRSPFAMARGMKENISEYVPEEVRFQEEGVGRVDFRSLGGSTYKVTFGFHESNIENEFKFRPIGRMPKGGEVDQGSPLVGLGGDVARMAKLMRDKFNMERFEFAELDAASIGHSKLTDYEFEYENFVELNDIRRAEF